MEDEAGFVLVSSGLPHDEAVAAYDILQAAGFDARLIGDPAAPETTAGSDDGYAVAVPPDQLEDALAILNPRGDEPEAAIYHPDPLTAVMPLIFIGGLLLAIVAVTATWAVFIDHGSGGPPGVVWGMLIAAGLVGCMLVFGPLLASGPSRPGAGARAIAARKSRIVS